MPKLYSCEVPVWATLYLAADSPEQAAEIAAARAGGAIEVTDGNVNIDGRPFEDCAGEPGYQGISPAMTISMDFKITPDDVEVAYEGGEDV